MKKLLLSVFVLAALLLTGCANFYLSQSELFIDEDGAVISVEYGKIDGEHVSTFKTPNGNEHEYKSSFSVRVTMTDGSRFQAYQVFNELMTGALYRSDNGKWTYHAKGNTCVVYRQIEDAQGKAYQPVFIGVVCRGNTKRSEESRR